MAKPGMAVYDFCVRLLSAQKEYHLLMKEIGQSLPAGFIWLCATASFAIAQSASQYHFPDKATIVYSQQDARNAVARGAAAPLEDVLRNATIQVMGELVGEKLELYQGVLLYELRFVASNGHVQFEHFLARTGQPYRPR